MTCTDACRERYGLTESRKKQLLRLKKLLNHCALTSQLSILGDLKRYLEDLEQLQVPADDNGQTNLLERVDVIREQLMRDQNWSAVAAEQNETIFSKVLDSTDEDIQKFASLYMSDVIEILSHAAKEGGTPHGPRSIATVRIGTQAGDRATTFHLSVKGDKKVMATPQGDFLRSALAVNCIDGDEEHLLIHPESKVSVVLNAASASLEIGNLHLPTIRELESDIGVSIAAPSELSSREWRQLGALEDDAILQLGFKRSSKAIVGEDHDLCCYILDKAFLVQRH